VLTYDVEVAVTLFGAVDVVTAVESAEHGAFYGDLQKSVPAVTTVEQLRTVTNVI
jgi:hypothetical protein